MMSLDDAILHAEEVEKSKLNQVKTGAWEKDSPTEMRCIKCASDHRQLAKWLKELKDRREKNAIYVDGKLLDGSKAVVKTFSPMTGEYIIGGFYEVKKYDK